MGMKKTDCMSMSAVCNTHLSLYGVPLLTEAAKKTRSEAEETQ